MRPSTLLFVSCLHCVVANALAAGPSDNAFSVTETRRQAGRESAEGQQHALFSRTVTPTLQVLRTEGKLFSALYQPTDKILLQHFQSGQLILWDFGRGAQIGAVKLPDGARAIQYRRALSEVLFLKDNKLWVTRLGSSTQATEWLPGKAVLAAVASVDSRFVYAAIRDGEILKLKSEGSSGIVVSPSAGRLGGTIVTDLRWAQDGELLVATDNGQIFKGPSQSLKETDRQAFSRQQLPLAQGGGSLHLEDSTLTLHRGGASQPIDSEVSYVALVGGNRYIYLRNDGQAFLRSADRTQYLVTLVSTPLGWVVVDQEGRYDGTIAGTKDVVWKAGDQQLTLDQFFDSYYKTGLLADYVNDKEHSLRKSPGNVRDGIFLPPKVEIDFPDGNLKAGKENKIVVVAESRGGDLGEEIRVFYNGKRLPPKAKVGAQKVQRENQILLAEVFAFTPEAGANEIFAEASNQHGIVGRSVVKKEVTDGFRSAGRLHMVVIGVDQYRQRELDLDFSKADATTLSKAIGQGASPVYDSIALQTLVDKQATKAGIGQALSSLNSVSPQDSVVVILAGHGVLDRDEWFFLPHDVNTKQIQQTGVSARLIQEALVASPAKRILLMVDACYSGGGIDTFNQYRDFQRRFAQQLGRATGITVLTAARRDQQAAEAAQLGHGLFSYVALEGLKGAADRSPKDGSITAHELAMYVGDQMPKQAERMGETRGAGSSGKDLELQTPSYFVIGADFPLAGGKP